MLNRHPSTPPAAPSAEPSAAAAAASAEPSARAERPRVTLRALEPEDLEMLYEVENDRTLWDVGVTNVPYSRFALREYIAGATGDIYADRQVRLIICVPGGEAVGMADLCNFDPRHRRAEVGIVVRREWCGRGIGHAALAELADYARRVLHLHQLYAVVAAARPHTVALFEDEGFRRTATLPQWLCDGEAYADAVLLQSFL